MLTGLIRCSLRAFAVVGAAMVVACVLTASALAAPGDVDVSFGNAGQSAALQRPAGGVFRLSNGSFLVTEAFGDPAYAHVSASGVVDNGFGAGGLSTPPSGDSCLPAQQSDSLIAACREDGTNIKTFQLRRMLSSGAWDSSFGTGGVTNGALPVIGYGVYNKVEAVTVSGDGTIYVLTSSRVPSVATVFGWTVGVAILAFDSTGAAVDSFGDHGRFPVPEASGLPTGLLVQPSGRLVATMESSNEGVTRLVGVTSAGAVDTSFGDNGVTTRTLTGAIAGMDGTGRIYFVKNGGGKTWLGGEATRIFVQRLSVDGAPDAAYGTSGVATLRVVDNGEAMLDAMLVEPSGKVFVSGFRQRYTSWTGTPTGSFSAVSVDDFFVARFAANGLPDTSFSGDGLAVIDGVPRSGGAVREPSGRFVVGVGAGQAGDAGSLIRFCGDDPSCDGVDASTLERGSGSADVMVGTFAVDLVSGGGGNDRISGRAGTDRIAGDLGADRLLGENGDDVLNGGVGADTLLGGADDDSLGGQAGNDALQGGLGIDSLLGGPGLDVLRGGVGNDTLNGNVGADRLFGDAGDDRLTGANGADTLTGGPGRDTLLGGQGPDRLLARDGVRDVVRCGSQNDTVIADAIDVVAADCESVSRPAS